MTVRGVVRGVVAVSVSLLVSGCWLQPDFDAGRTRWNRWEDQITATNVASLEEVWSVTGAGSLSIPPLVYGDRVFVPAKAGSSTAVRAMDAATGETVWGRVVGPPEGDGYPHSVAFVEDELWVNYWPSTVDDCAGTVRLDRDGTVVGSEERVPLSPPMQSGPYVVERYQTGCTVSTDNPQYVSVRDSRTLETLWTAEAGGFAVSGDLVITSLGAFPLAGCGASTCSPLWTYTESVVGAGPGTDVFFYSPGGFHPDLHGRLHVVSRATGTRTWSAPIPWQSERDDFAIDDKHIYVTSKNTDTTVLAYPIDGCGAETCSPAWQATVGPDVVDSWVPTVAGDVLYIAGRDGRVYAFPTDGCGPGSSSDCPEIASIDTGFGDDIRNMSVSGGRLFVVGQGSDGFTVKAFAPMAAPGSSEG